MRNIVASLLCVFAILANGPADAQWAGSSCASGSCGVSVGYGYGYTLGRSLGAVYAPYSYSHPASSYAAYAVPYAVRAGTPAVPVFSQYGGSGHVYTTAGDPAALTAWIRLNDPARVAVPVPVAPCFCRCNCTALGAMCQCTSEHASCADPDCKFPGKLPSVDSKAVPFNERPRPCLVPETVQPSPVPSTLPTPLSPPSSSLGSQDPVGNAFVAWLNGHRAARGLGPVAWDSSLVYLCSANNSEQIRRGLGHWVMRCRRQNAGMGSYQQVVTMWIASPLHATALFDPSITRVAIVGDGAYWTFDAN